MSIKFFHQVIVFAAMSVALLFAAYCFFDPSVAGSPLYIAGGVVCIGLAIGLVFYEIHFLKRTRKIIIH